MEEPIDEEVLKAKHRTNLITFSKLLKPNDLVSIKLFEGEEVQGLFVKFSKTRIYLDRWTHGFSWETIASIEIHYPYKNRIAHGRRT